MAEVNPETNWIKIADLAGDLGVSRRTIDRWRRDEAFSFPKAFHTGARLFFLRSEIDAWKARVQTEGVRR